MAPGWLPVNENQAARLTRMGRAGDSWSNASHLICQGYRLPADFDTTRLAWAVEELAGRHDALSTVFDPAALRQRVGRTRPTLTSIRHAEERCDPPAATQALDLTTGPTARFILSDHDGHHDLWITVEHLVSDGWAMRLIARELDQLVRSGRPFEQAPTAQNADHAAWEAAYCDSDAGRRALAHWDSILSGGSPWPELVYPGSRRPGAFDRDATTSVTVKLGVDEVAALNGRCREAGVSGFVAVLDALGAAARARTGLSRVGLLSPVANRWSTKLKGAVTFASSLVPLFVPCPGDPATRLTDLRNQVLDAVRYGQYPIHRYTRERHPGEWGRPQSKPLLYADLVDTVLPTALGRRIPDLDEPVVLGLGLWADLDEAEPTLTFRHPRGFLPDGELEALAAATKHNLTGRPLAAPAAQSGSADHV